MNPESSYLNLQIARIVMLLTLVVIALGASTRLADAGLGCPDWPGCYGHLLWPDTAEEIAAANQAWPDSPVDTERTSPEMVHRYAAGLLALLSLFIGWDAWRKRKIPTYPVLLGMLLPVLVICQALFGMWTVSLKLLPQIVTGHLLLGFGFGAVLWLYVLRLNRYVHSHMYPRIPPFFRPSIYLVPALWTALVLILLQIALGGWLTSNYAALACPDLPTCQNSWLPNTDFAAGFNLLQSVGPNYLGGVMDNEARIAIHLAHRIGSVICLIYLVSLCIVLLRPYASTVLRKPANYMLVIVLIQFLLGLGNIVFDFPHSVAVLHNLGALLLLLCAVTLLYCEYENRPQKR